MKTLMRFDFFQWKSEWEEEKLLQKRIRELRLLSLSLRLGGQSWFGKVVRFKDDNSLASDDFFGGLKGGESISIIVFILKPQNLIWVLYCRRVLGSNQGKKPHCQVMDALSGGGSHELVGGFATYYQ
ncbi:hypothetical protein NE237_004584 [Protea cynaroides]|uniref:Uncharacterized protein n=1 Tax=Protea cynaroides TaxID=273540 RepID=A0A9Q0QTH1_9MAGN|nr:hypothetical protein NE237_004584 [Protea cynaroides]